MESTNTTTNGVPTEPAGKHYPRHEHAHANGGLILHDEGNIMG